MVIVYDMWRRLKELVISSDESHEKAESDNSGDGSQESQALDEICIVNNLLVIQQNREKTSKNSQMTKFLRR